MRCRAGWCCGWTRARRRRPSPASTRMPDVISGTQGSMETLGGSKAFVGWGGMRPEFTEYAAPGEIAWDARFLPQGVESYRAYTMPWSGTPTSPPDVKLRGAAALDLLERGDGRGPVAAHARRRADGDDRPRRLRDAGAVPGAAAARAGRRAERNGDVVGDAVALQGGLDRTASSAGVAPGGVAPARRPRARARRLRRVAPVELGHLLQDLEERRAVRRCRPARRRT